MLTFKLEVRNLDLYTRNSFALTQSIPWTSKSQPKHRSYWMVSNYMNLDHTTSFSLPPHLDIEMVSISFTSKHPAERPKSTVQPVASAGTSPDTRTHLLGTSLTRGLQMNCASTPLPPPPT